MTTVLFVVVVVLVIALVVLLAWLFGHDDAVPPRASEPPQQLHTGHEPNDG